MNWKFFANEDIMIKWMNSIRKQYNEMPVGVRAAFWYTISSFVQRAIAFLTNPIFTRLMSTEEYGTWTVYISYYGILEVLVTLQLASGGFGKAMVKYKDERREYISSITTLLVVLVLFWSVLYFIGKNFFDSLLGLPMPYILSMFVTMLMSQVFAIWAAWKRFEYQYREVVITTVISAILVPVISLVGIIHNLNSVDARVYGMALGYCIPYSFVLIKTLCGGKCFYRASFWKFAISFGIAMVPHYLSNTILSSSDRIMISKMVGDTEAALYGIAYTVANIMMLFLSSVMSAFSPWMLTKINDNDFKSVKKVTNLMGVCFFVLAVLPIIVAPDVISILATDEYIDSIWVIPPVSASIYFLYLHNLFSVFSFYYEKKFYIVFASSVSAFMNVILNYIFIGIFGYLAAGYTTLVCYILFSLFDLCFMRKLCTENGIKFSVYDMRKLFGLSALSVIIALFGNLLYINSAVRYVFLISIVLLIVFHRQKLIDLYQALKSK